MKRTGLLFLAAALAFAAEPQFEVATVRLNAAGGPGGTVPGVRNGKFSAQNISLKRLISFAYSLPEFQISGPDWLDSHFDVVATLPEGTAPAQAKQMLGALLEERFHLQAHRDTPEMNHYALVVGKGGSKLKELVPGEPFSISSMPKVPPGGGTMMTVGTLAEFAGQLAPMLGRPVLDKTGIAGTFRVIVVWGSLRGNTDGGSESGPDVFTAVQEQLGLKLEPQKGPVERLIVDHADKVPTEN